MKEPSKQTVRALRKEEDEQIEVSFTTMTIDHPNNNEIAKKLPLLSMYNCLLQKADRTFSKNQYQGALPWA
jgi:hypothetical protein